MLHWSTTPLASRRQPRERHPVNGTESGQHRTATIAPLTATLASNPFCTRLVRPGSVEYRFCEQTNGEPKPDDSQSRCVEIVSRLQQHRCGVIVGAHGSGKTTLLHSLRPALCDAFADIENVRLFASASGRLLARCQHARRLTKQVYSLQAQLWRGGLLVVDGAEQLWRPDLTRLLRKARRRGQAVLATSHSPVGGMTILHETEVTSVLVSSLTESLLTEASPQVAKIVQAELGRQDWSTLTNVRDLWFELYDVVQPHVVPPARLSVLQE